MKMFFGLCIDITSTLYPAIKGNKKGPVHISILLLTTPIIRAYRLYSPPRELKPRIGKLLTNCIKLQHLLPVFVPMNFRNTCIALK